MRQILELAARRRAVFRAAWILLAGLPVQAAAHSFTVTDTLAVLKNDDTFLIDVRVDVDALALGVADTTDSALVVSGLQAMTAAEFEECVEQLRDMVQRRVRIRFDEEKVQPAVSFPEFVAQDVVHYSEGPEGANIPSVLGVTIRLSGAIPPEAETFSFGASRAFRAVHLTILDQVSAGGVRHILEPGANSPPYTLGAAPPEVRWPGVARQYLVLGFTHILPYGLDHILFVLGLFLLSTKWKPLLWQITAFTVAHSVTLALSIYGVISLTPWIVESLIALSISYVAIENMLTRELKPWRPAIVFGFGLLHGLGFAGVLEELGLPREEFTTALIAFNVGVEIGQLAVVAGAFALVGWFSGRDWYRKAIVLPASGLIAAVGLYWCVERVIGG